jgi:hypothetical protein
MTTLLTIKDLNLGEEKKIQEIASKLDWSVESVLECDDFHTENSALDMLEWIYEGDGANTVLYALDEAKVIDPTLSLLENLLLNQESVFSIDGGYLFFYI